MSVQLQGELWGSSASASASTSLPGLSKAHISTLSERAAEALRGSITIWRGGSAVEVKRGHGLIASAGRSGGGRRGIIREFSEQSRRRLLEWFGRVDASACRGVFFMTLTGRPSELTWDNVHRVLERWRMRLWRRWYGAGRWFVVWRIEPHKSGAPHVHALWVWVGQSRIPLLADVRAWNDVAWRESVKARDLAFCRVEWVRAWQGVRGYLSKYVAKVRSEPDRLAESVPVVGRQWGVWNRPAVPVDPVTVPLSVRTARRVYRWLHKLARRRCESWEVCDSGRRVLRRVPVVASPAGLAVPGCRVRRRRPRLCRRVHVEQWADHPDGRAVVVDDWYITLGPRVLFVDAGLASRVVDHAVRLELAELEEERDLPF